jgi:hypothetical protein
MERDRRVDRVVDLMTRGEWQGARSARELAGEWDVHMHTVHDYAREASGIIRRSLEGDAEDLRAQLLAGLDELTRKATSAGEYRAAIAGFELRAKVLGLVERRTKEDQPPPNPFASPEEALRFAEGLVLRLREQIATARPLPAALPSEGR